MPITLIVKDPAGPDLPLALDGERIVVGRGAGADVRLPDPSVSSRHATLRAQGGDYSLLDEGSSNGTWVGNTKLAPKTPRLLRDGEELRFGRVRVRVKLGAAMVAPDARLATREVAMALVLHAMQSLGDEVTPKVRVLQGRDLGEEMVLDADNAEYVIGRSEGCDLALADIDASREHLRIVRRGSVVFLIDLGSKNGTYLGTRRLPANQEVAWKAEQTVRIGATHLALYEPVAVALAQLDELPDEKIPEREIEEAASGIEAAIEAKAANSAVASESSVEAPQSTLQAEQSVPIGDDIVRYAPIFQEPSERQFAKATVNKKADPTRGIKATDLVIAIAAVITIATSIAGLLWLLKG
jgi:pSer/pThr/pTyr-binding forkhead associated (FHA) protein